VCHSADYSKKVSLGSLVLRRQKDLGPVHSEAKRGGVLIASTLTLYA
jgi:hypothetical protein